MKSVWLLAVVVLAACVATGESAQCNCNCPRNQPVCGKDSTGDVDTFPSDCALKCYNCTFGKDYYVTKKGACSSMDMRRGRRAVNRWTRMLRARRHAADVLTVQDEDFAPRL